MTIKQNLIRKQKGLNKPSPPFNPNPQKDSNRSKKRENRGFSSLEVSSRKHRRAKKRLGFSLSPNPSEGIKARKYQDYHS